MRRPLKRFPPRKPRNPTVFLGRHQAETKEIDEVQALAAKRVVRRENGLITYEDWGEDFNKRFIHANKRSVRITARYALDQLSNLDPATQQKILGDRNTLAKFVWALWKTSNPMVAGAVVSGLPGRHSLALHARHRVPGEFLQAGPDVFSKVEEIGRAKQVPPRPLQIADRIQRIQGRIEQRHGSVWKPFRGLIAPAPRNTLAQFQVDFPRAQKHQRVLMDPELQRKARQGDKEAAAQIDHAFKMMVGIDARHCVSLISNLARGIQRKLLGSRGTLARFVWGVSVMPNPAIVAAAVLRHPEEDQPLFFHKKHRIPPAITAFSREQFKALQAVVSATEIPDNHFIVADRIREIQDLV